MKIGILTERLVAGFGVDLVVHEQAERLGQKGHDVRVFVLRRSAFQSPQHYTVVQFSDAPPAIENFALDFMIGAWLVENEAETYDVWILHTPPFYAWVRHLSTSVVFVEYGSPPGYFFDQDTAYGLWKLASDHLGRDYGLLRPGDAIVSISLSIHNSLPRSAQTYSTVQLLGADHYADAEISDAEAFRSRHGVSEGDVLLLWVGRMQFSKDEQPYKGFSELLDILPAIKSISPKIKIALLGKVARDEEHYLAHQGVILLANHPHQEMGVAFASADILLNLSRWEGFNLALVEAQRQGTPVIALDIGPHPEVCRNGVTALLVDHLSDVIPAIRQLVDDPALRRRMAQNARSFARSFTWDRNAELLSATLAAALFSGRTTKGLSREPIKLSMLSFLKTSSYYELLLLNGETFVQNAFVTFLRRLPEPPAKKFYVEKLKKTDKLKVLLDISSSEEAKNSALRFERLERYRKLGKLHRRYRLWRDLRRARLENYSKF